MITGGVQIGLSIVTYWPATLGDKSAQVSLQEGGVHTNAPHTVALL